MRTLAFTVLLLICPSPCLAEVKVRGEAVYAPYKKIALKAVDVSSKAQYLWDVDGECDVVEAGDTLYVWAAPGSYRVMLTAVDFEAKKVERARFSFKVEGDAPPKPPDPKPPEPPTPPTSGLRVLILEESAERAKLPSAQLAVLFAEQVRTYLEAKCVPGPDGKTKEWRIWDKDTTTHAERDKNFREWIGRKRTSLPWIVIQNNATIYEGPLPANVTDTLALLKKFGG